MKTAALLLYFLAASAWAQSLAPVASAPPPQAAGGSWLTGAAIGIGAGVLIVLAGFLWLRRRYPATAAKIETGADQIGKIAAEAAKAAIAHLQANHPAPAAAAAGEPPAAPAADPLAPQLDDAKARLANIRAILDAPPPGGAPAQP